MGWEWGADGVGMGFGGVGWVVAEVFWRGVFSEVLLITLVRFLKRVLVRF